jgi:MFS family permease
MALQISIGMMLFPSLGLAVLPTYESIGMLAPILLLIIRLLQGAAAGGELVGSILFIVESAPSHQRGLLGALCFTFAIVGTMMGTLAASIATSLLSKCDLDSYGWRLAFVFGFLLGLSGVWLRRGLEESEEFMEAQSEIKAGDAPPPNPLKEAVTKYPKEVASVITVCAIWCCGFYTCFIWIGTLYGSVHRLQLGCKPADLTGSCRRWQDHGRPRVCRVPSRPPAARALQIPIYFIRGPNSSISYAPSACRLGCADLQ